MKETIKAITNKYYQKNEDCYSGYRYDENDKEFEVGQELKKRLVILDYNIQ